MATEKDGEPFDFSETINQTIEEAMPKPQLVQTPSADDLETALAHMHQQAELTAAEMREAVQHVSLAWEAQQQNNIDLLGVIRDRKSQFAEIQAKLNRAVAENLQHEIQVVAAINGGAVAQASMEADKLIRSIGA